MKIKCREFEKLGNEIPLSNRSSHYHRHAHILKSGAHEFEGFRLSLIGLHGIYIAWCYTEVRATRIPIGSCHLTSLPPSPNIRRCLPDSNHTYYSYNMSFSIVTSCTISRQMMGYCPLQALVYFQPN